MLWIIHVSSEWWASLPSCALSFVHSVYRSAGLSCPHTECKPEQGGGYVQQNLPGIEMV